MIFSNLQELFDKKEEILQKKSPYDKAIMDARKEQKNTKKRTTKEYWEDVINNYKDITTPYDEELLKIDNILNQSRIFPKEILMPFILECINIIEDEKYVSRNLVLSQTCHITTYDTLPAYNHFEMIFPESILEEETKLESTFYFSVLQVAYKELFEKSKVKYIMMPSDGYFQILTHELTMLTYFNKFPYLEEIAINLIERRLREPEKKIQDIFNDELESLKEQQKTKTKN